jgi:acetyltransferase-like isoleucine patch superfamily enzyme
VEINLIKLLKRLKDIMSLFNKKPVRTDHSIRSPFTKDNPNYKQYEIGDFTYGTPRILAWGEEAKVKIGKFCSIADNVTIFLGGNHRTDWITTFPFTAFSEYFPESEKITGHPSTKGDVIIGNDVWIGMGVVIMSGLTIGSGSVIAAYSVVTKNVKPYEIVGGNPAKHLKFRFDEQKIEELLKISWWEWPIEKIKSSISYLCSNQT